MPRLLPTLLALACTTTGAAGVARADRDAIAVEFIAVTRATSVVQLSLTGTIEARDSINAGFREGGRITEVLVSEAETVRQGQPLARIDSLQQQEALNVARAALSAAEAQAVVARQSSDRAEAMLARGIGTRAARDAAAEALTAAVTAAEQARTQAELSARALDNTTILAPFDGVVTSRAADPGQIVGAAQTVLRVARLDSLRAVFQAPDDPRLSDTMGTPVVLHPIDRPQVEMTAHVTEIAPLIGPATGSVEVHAAIDNPDADADTGRLGAPVRATVTFPAAEGIWLPWTALMRAGTGPAVWTVGEDNRALLRPIVVQRYGTGGFLVESGLEPGEVVIGAGSQMVYPGRLVTPATQVDGRPTGWPAEAGP